jgi:TolB-like protein
MKNRNAIIWLILLIAFALSPNCFSQVKRIAFLPFQNMDGNMVLNIYCYQLQDSLSKAFALADPEEKYYHIIPSDSVDGLLAEMNLDPNNPQYATDMWKAAKMLAVEYVVTGNFNMQAKRLLINAYVYDVITKLPDPDHQARDLFKKEEQVLSAVSVMLKQLKPFFEPE